MAAIIIVMCWISFFATANCKNSATQPPTVSTGFFKSVLLALKSRSFLMVMLVYFMLSLRLMSWIRCNG